MNIMKVVINADDFGINEVVTYEIERMIELGAISSTTIMANGLCLDEVKRFTELHPEISFGIHFCISEFDSITKSQTFYKYGLLNEDGTFVKHKIFSLESFPEDLREAIRVELESQVKVLKDLGINISHADSHHHSHTIPEISDVFMTVMKNNGIKRVRLGMQPDIKYMISKRLSSKKNNGAIISIPSGQQENSARPVKLMNLVKKITRYARLMYNRVRLNKSLKKNFAVVNRFFPYEEFYLRFEEFKDSNNTFELMCHPGHLGVDYKREMELVEKRKILECNNVKLINYEQI